MNQPNNRKKFAIFFLLAAALVGIPLTVYLAGQEQDQRSSAAVVSEDTVVVVIDGQQYKKSDVRKIAEEYNDPTVVDDATLREAVDILAERQILDKAASSLGIALDQDKVSQLVNAGVSETDAKYEVLAGQVALKVVRSREAVSIGFWNPPQEELSSLTADEKSAAANELRDGIPALTEAESSLKNSDNLIEIADGLLTKYQTLRPVLAVNGYIISPMDTSGRNEAATPKVYGFGDSGFDRPTRDALFAMNVGEVRKVTNTSDNRGGYVLKLISKGAESGENSYDAWLSKQKQSVVQNLNLL